MGGSQAPPLSPSLCPHPQSVQGTGLAFIAFTEAMTHFPASPFWSVMFFLMLINLGLGSMIGTMAGITTPIIDTFKVPKEMFTGNSSPRPPLSLWAALGDRGQVVALTSGRWGSDCVFHDSVLRKLPCPRPTWGTAGARLQRGTPKSRKGEGRWQVRAKPGLGARLPWFIGFSPRGPAEVSWQGWPAFRLAWHPAHPCHSQPRGALCLVEWELRTSASGPHLCPHPPPRAGLGLRQGGLQACGGEG